MSVNNGPVHIYSHICINLLCTLIHTSAKLCVHNVILFININASHSSLHSSLNINDHKHLKVVLLRLLYHLHRRVRDRLHLRALRMLANLERLAVATTLQAKLLQVQLGDDQLRADQRRFYGEQEQQLVEELKQQAVQVVALRFDLEALANGHGVDFGHVAEHGEAALLEGLAQRSAPGVESAKTAVISQAMI